MKPYLDPYRRMKPSDPDHTYKYLLDSVEDYLTKTKQDRNLVGLTKKKQERRLAPAAPDGQCPHFLKGGCGDPENCTLGLHDPQFKHA